MNVAYTENFKMWQRNCESYFAPQFLINCPDKITKLTDSFSVRSRFYSGEKDGYSCTMSENELLDENGKAIYKWRNLDGQGIVSLFKHSNNKHYLIFSLELYGYSILEIESKLTFHYVPSQSFSQNMENFEETFIWVSASYDQKNNLLAVDGCFWAYPDSVLILDFTDPLCEKPTEIWKDVHTEIDVNYERYCHISCDQWDENGNLYIKMCNVETDNEESILLTADKLKSWLQT